MKILLIGGVVLFFGSLALLASKYSDLAVEGRGIIVKMRIEELPSSCSGTRIKHFAKVSYQGENYIKRIPAGYCDEHNVGDLILMKYLEGSTIILFPKESVLRNLISLGVLGLSGLGMIIYHTVKSRR